MPSLRSSALRFRSTINNITIVAVVAVAAGAVAGCGNDSGTCGPSGTESGVFVTAAPMALATYSSFTASANNDCPVLASPTSLTITSDQDDGAGSLVLCLAQPELVGTMPLPVSTDGAVRLLSLSGETACPFLLDRTRSFELEATFSGFCDDGVNSAGFGLALSGSVPILEQCPNEADKASTFTVSGLAAVTAGEN